MKFTLLILTILISRLSFAELKPGETVFPLLKSTDWPIKQHALNTPLYNIQNNDLPLVAYSINSEDDYQILSKYEEGLNLEDIHAQAINNLCSLEFKLEKFNEYTLTASGSDFSSELILCPNFFSKVQEKLNTDKLWVSIPRRTVIYIASVEIPEKEKKEFFYLSMYTYHDESFGNEMISDVFLEYEKGQLVSLFSLNKK